MCFNTVLTQLYSEHSGGTGSYPSVHPKLDKCRLWPWGKWSWWCLRTLLSGHTSKESERRVRWWLCFCASTIYLASVPSVLICLYPWEKYPREPWHSNASARTPSSSWLGNTHPDTYRTSATCIVPSLLILQNVFYPWTNVNFSWVSTLKKEVTNSKAVSDNDDTKQKWYNRTRETEVTRPTANEGVIERGGGILEEGNEILIQFISSRWLRCLANTRASEGCTARSLYT